VSLSLRMSVLAALLVAAGAAAEAQTVLPATGQQPNAPPPPTRPLTVRPPPNVLGMPLRVNAPNGAPYCNCVASNVGGQPMRGQEAAVVSFMGNAE
jgi:hypothetical protein